MKNQQQPQTNIVSRAYVLGAALFFSTGGAAIKSSELSSLQIAGLRSGLAAVLLWCLVPAWRKWWRPSSLAVGTAFAATLILFVTANTLTTAANAIFLQYSAPLYVLLLGPRLLGEKSQRSDLVLLVLLALGMLLIFVGQQTPSRTAPDPLQGNLLGACSGFTWAITLLGLRRLGRRGGGAGSDGAAVIAGNALAFAICLPLALPVHEATTTDWAVVSYLGFFQTGIAYVCLLRGVRGLRAFEISLLLAIEPVASGVWAWLVHGEIPTAAASVGCALVFASVLLQALRKEQARPAVT